MSKCSPTLSLKKINNWHRSTTGTQEVTHEHNQASSQQLPIARKSLRIDDLCDSGKTRRKARYSSRRGGVGGSDVSLPRCHVAGIKALLVHYEADAIMKSFHPLTFAIYLATLLVGGGERWEEAGCDTSSTVTSLHQHDIVSSSRRCPKVHNGAIDQANDTPRLSIFRQRDLMTSCQLTGHFKKPTSNIE